MSKNQVASLLENSGTRLKKYQIAITEAEKSFRELDSKNMQGTLIQIEDYLDSNHLYSFANWIEGIVWDGPIVKRYWISITLKYPYKKMPDPQGALRLVNSGATVTFKESVEYVPIEVKQPDDLDPATRKPKEEKIDIWLITIRVPRRFIEAAIDDYEEMEPGAKQQEEQQTEEAETEEEAPEEEFGGEELEL